MSLRHGRPARRDDGRPMALFSRYIALARGRYRFTADNVVEDPSHAGFVLRIIDHNNPARWLEQTDPTKQVAMPAAHADFGGRKCLTFTGSQAYQSNEANTAWAFTADGISCQSVRVFTPLAGAGTRVSDVTTAAANQRGQQVYWASGGDVTAALYKTGAAVVAPTAVGAVGQDVATYVSLRFSSSSANQYEFRRKSALIASGAYVSAPESSGSSGVPLTIGSVTFPGITAGATERLRELAFFPALSAAQWLVVTQFMQTFYGLAP